MVVELAEQPQPVSLRWDLSLIDLAWTVFIDRDVDGVVTWEEVQASEQNIARAVLSELAVERGGSACTVEFEDLALARRIEENYLSVAMRARCPAAGQLQVGGALFLVGDAAQRVLLSATRGAQTFTGVISAAEPAWLEPRQVSAWENFARFIGEGVWHVLIGADHIAFILLLLLPSVLRAVDGKWHGTTRLSQVARDLITIITAFTVAHSTTLALAVTGTVRLPSQPIEIAIAASIAIAGLINLLPRMSAARLPLAFGFGLVHGFGFANVLSEIDDTGVTLLPLLAGFNIGVEIAQLAIVASVLPLIYAARAQGWYARGVMPLGSCALAAMGLVWMVQRIGG